jgi:hypothetical protein
MMVAVHRLQRAAHVQVWGLILAFGIVTAAGLNAPGGLDRAMTGRAHVAPGTLASLPTPARYMATGPVFSSGAFTVRLQLRAIGFGTALERVDDPTLQEATGRAVYARPGVREWYSSRTNGVEQGFNIERRPAHYGAGPLTLAISVAGGGQPLLTPVRRALVVHSRSGSSGSGSSGSFTYSDLRATDADGAPLRSWLTAGERTIFVHVATGGARYPISIDPYIQQGGKLTANGGSSFALFGAKLALSGDGATALATAIAESPAIVFPLTRSGSAWVEGPPLKVSGAPRGLTGGLALSADGQTALVGAPSEGKGAAWIFKRDGEQWHQGPELVSPHAGGVASSSFGGAVALSADGTTALVGDSNDDEGDGTAWVFERSEGEWSAGHELMGSSTVGSARFGASVALSDDGGTALVGGPGNENVIAEPDGEVTEGSLIVRGLPTTVGFASSIVTGPGIPQYDAVQTVLGEHEVEMTKPADGEGGTTMEQRLTFATCCGSAWAFVRDGATWAQQGQPMTASTGPSDDVRAWEFGEFVALSDSGDRALIGPSEENRDPVVPVFDRSGNTWTRSALLRAAGHERPFGFGSSAALSGSGEVAVIGAPSDQPAGSVEEPPGSAFIFTASGGTWTQQTSKLTGSQAVGPAEFGSSLAVDETGDTILIGGPFDKARGPEDAGSGAVWAFALQPPPPAVSLISPADGAVTSSPRPTFTWSARDQGGPGLAQVQLLIDGKPSAAFALGATTYTPATPLPDGVHTWQIRAADSLGYSTTTAPRAIAVDTLPPTTPVLGTPANDARVFQPAPTFTWAPASDATSGVASYTLMLDGAVAAQLASTACGGACSLSAPHALGNGRHSWAIVATDRVGDEAPSATQRFTVAVGPPSPPGPVGLSINKGDYATNSPRVNLDVVWPAGVTSAFVSNDGGFQLTGQTQSLTVAARIPWRLSSQGSERLPRTVYVRFPDSSDPVTTFTDSIILDTTTPVVHEATISPPLSSGGTRHIGLTVQENRSGVSVVDLSERPAGGTIIRFRSRRERGLVGSSVALRIALGRSTGAGNRGASMASAPTFTIRPPRHLRWVRVQSAAGSWSSWRKIAHP